MSRYLGCDRTVFFTPPRYTTDANGHDIIIFIFKLNGEQPGLPCARSPLPRTAIATIPVKPKRRSPFPPKAEQLLTSPENSTGHLLSLQNFASCPMQAGISVVPPSENERYYCGIVSLWNSGFHITKVAITKKLCNNIHETKECEVQASIEN